MTVIPLARRFRGAVLLAFTATILASFPTQARATAAVSANVQILVKPKSSMSEVALHALLSSRGAKEHGDIPALKVRIVRVPAAAASQLLNALSNHPDVDYAEADFVAKAIGAANDPYYVDGSEWHLAKIQASAAWDLSTGSTGVVIAVIDSGANYGHPDLAGKLLSGYDFINNDSDPTDDNGHGTAVSGTAAPASNNSLGVAGVAWANPVLPVKVLGADGSGNYSAIANGVTYAADRGARIINLSLGGTSSSRTLQSAINYAFNKNCVIIAAAGNDGNSSPVYPAACSNVVAVSATNFADTRPTWSNYGSYVDISAPGDGILTLYGANAYASLSGTSFSSPVTAGVAALMASVNPRLSNIQIVDLLLKNTDDIGAAGYDVYYGRGRVNAYRAVSAAKSLLTADTSAPVAAIASPTDGSTVSGTQAVSVSATDNTGVTRLELYVDTNLVAQSSAPSATFSLNTLNYADGAHTLKASAYDAAGNVGAKSILVTVQNSTSADSTAPIATITSPVNGAILTSPSQKIYVKGTDNVAVKKLELYIDGKLFGTSTSASTVFSWSTLKVVKGQHTLQAYAYDAAGNVGTSALITVVK